MNVTEERKELFKALSMAQKEFTTVAKDKENPHFKSKFAPLDTIIEMLRPILPKHGLAFMQFNDTPEDGQGVIIETIITHESGQFISGRLLMPMAKQDPQGCGSAITYGRRYALAAALGIVSDEDVDGNDHKEKSKDNSANMPKLNKELFDELLAYCEGDLEKANTLLKRLSHYKDGEKEYFFDLDRLPKTSEKWVGKVLTKLRKQVSTEAEARVKENKMDSFCVACRTNPCTCEPF
jgi:hypothetical protein